MKKVLLIAVFLCQVFAGSAQVGYLGKRFTVTSSVTIAPPIFNNRIGGIKSQFNNINVTSDWAIFPPEIGLNGGAVISERVQFKIGAAWRGLQNTHFTSFRSENIGLERIIYSDFFRLRTNVIDLKASFRFFYEYAPVGKYFDIGFSSQRAASIVYPSYNIIRRVIGSSEQTTTSDKREPGVYANRFFRVFAGFGRTFLINRELIMDYGFRVSYILPFNSNPEAVTETNGSYQDHFPEIIHSIQKSNIQSSYAIEVYAQFGIFK
jgi:hypothetical protein